MIFLTILFMFMIPYVSCMIYPWDIGKQYAFSSNRKFIRYINSTNDWRIEIEDGHKIAHVQNPDWKGVFSSDKLNLSIIDVAIRKLQKDDLSDMVLVNRVFHTEAVLHICQKTKKCGQWEGRKGPKVLPIGGCNYMDDKCGYKL